MEIAKGSPRENSLQNHLQPVAALGWTVKVCPKTMNRTRFSKKEEPDVGNFVMAYPKFWQQGRNIFTMPLTDLRSRRQ